MNFLWKIARNTIGVVGGLVAFLAASTSDYYVLELGQTEPSYINHCIIIGTLCMVPMMVHLIKEYRKENM